MLKLSLYHKPPVITSELHINIRAKDLVEQSNFVFNDVIINFQVKIKLEDCQVMNFNLPN